MGMPHGSGRIRPPQTKQGAWRPVDGNTHCSLGWAAGVSTLWRQWHPNIPGSAGRWPAIRDAAEDHEVAGQRPALPPPEYGGSAMGAGAWVYRINRG